MAPLTCELWQVWCALTFSDLWSQHCEGSLKNSCHSFSVWPLGTGENFLPSPALWSHRSQDEVLHFAQILSSLSIWLGRHHYNKSRSRIFKKQNTRIVTRRQYIERNNTGKLTFGVISECRLCFYSGHSGMKSGVLRKLLMCKVKLRVDTDT